MALVQYSVTLVDHVNNPNNTLAFSALQIRTNQPGSPLASIFSDADGLSPIPQPGAQTDDFGVFVFYAEFSEVFQYTANYNAGGQNRFVVLTSSSIETKTQQEKFYQSLNSGQTLVTTQVEATTGIFFISDSSNDGISRKLTPITFDTPNGDYNVINSSTISLRLSFNSGAYLTEIGGANFNPIYKTGFVPGEVEVIAHRGLRDTSFQNTALALSASLSRGAKSLEMDASISDDGVWYLFHDSTVDALTDGTGTFINLQSSYIDTLKYTKADGTIYEGLGITRLDDALKIIKDLGVKAYIEIKNPRNNTTDVDDIISKFNDFGVANQINVSSFSSDVVARCRIAMPSIETGVIMNTNDANLVVTTVKGANANSVINNYQQMDKSFADTVYSNGIDIIAYTVDRKSDFNDMLSAGIRKIMTDKSTF